MSKKFTELLKALSTPDIRSVLRWLNNNIEKKVKPTELASMKHDRCLVIIEEKYTPANIERALAEYASVRRERTPTTPPAIGERRSFDSAVKELHQLGDTLDSIVKDLRATTGHAPASYILEMSPTSFAVIAAGSKGATIIEDGFKTLDDARKGWPEAIAPTGEDANTIDDILG